MRDRWHALGRRTDSKSRLWFDLGPAIQIQNPKIREWTDQISATITNHIAHYKSESQWCWHQIMVADANKSTPTKLSSVKETEQGLKSVGKMKTNKKVSYQPNPLLDCHQGGDCHHHTRTSQQKCQGVMLCWGSQAGPVLSNGFLVSPRPPRTPNLYLLIKWCLKRCHSCVSFSVQLDLQCQAYLLLSSFHLW